MNILITGGYGFIGSHVAERFFQGGYRVSIIDNLSRGQAQNVQCRHSFYKLDIADKKCEEVFKSCRFDAVVHLAAQAGVSESLEDPYEDSRSNLLGLTNMLRLAAHYGVKRFILASSAAVYGNNEEVPLTEDARIAPLSPYGLSKSVGELYCQRWKDLYGLETVCLRFSNVYGPRQGTTGEGGVISAFLERAFAGKELVVYGDGRQTRDFIYVGDVAEGIFRAVKAGLSGVFNLSTNEAYSINELLAMINGCKALGAVAREEAREGDIQDSRLDNSRLKKVLGWEPTLTLAEGLKITCAWYEEFYAQKRRRRKKKDSEAALGQQIGSRLSRLKLIPYLESGLLFCLACFLQNISQRSSYRFSPDYLLVYIIVMGGVYGIRQGLLAAVLACAWYISRFIDGGYPTAALISDTSSLLQLSFYLLGGVILGYLSDRKNEQLQIKEDLLREAQERYDFLTALHQENLAVKAELQEQILNNRDSFGKVYEMVRELNRRELKEVYAGAVKVLESVARTKRVAVYGLADKTMIALLTAKSDEKDFQLPSLVKIRERPDIMKALSSREIYVNRELAPHLPLLTAPIIHEGKALAVAMIFDAEFEQLTLHRYNLCKIAIDLISSFAANVYGYSGQSQTSEAEMSFSVGG